MYLAKQLHLNMIGINFHLGSNSFEDKAYKRVITVAKHLYQLIDIDGGFTGDNDDYFQTIAEKIQTSLAHHFPNTKDDDLVIIAEPGSFFVSAASTLICKIFGQRVIISETGKCKQFMYYLNDGCYGSFKLFLCHPKDYFITVKHFLDETKLKRKKYKTISWGPTCDSVDKIIDDIYLPEFNCDDLLYFPNMGAYTITMSTTFNASPKGKILYFLCQN